ncbi:unnamed protein product, partial [Brenthis ino]
MDPNENNNLFESVQLELITIKAELKEEPLEVADITNQEEDRMSDTSNSSKANVKRRRYSNSQDEESSANSNPVLSTSNSQDRQERRIFTLYVTNTPGEWTSNQIIDFIKEQCGIHISKINDSREANSEAYFQIKLKFTNREQLDRVFLKLKEKEVEGKLTAQLDDVHDDSQSDAESETIVQIGERDSGETEEATGNAQNIECDENSFHMKEDYLQSLGIKLPLTNWVTVTNFRCDKSELKEVLELCGKVLICSVVTISTKYANVMYSHPLEAVQAISMLNGQKFYGKPLKLTMNNEVDMKTFLPKGLADVGPGLGKFGKPLPDLAEQYKNFVEGKNSSINAYLFHPDLLDKLGVTVDEDSSYARPVNNSPSNEDNTSDRSRESSPNARNVQASQFGPIGQRPPRPRSTPINTRPQFHNNPISNFNNRVNGPIVPRGVNSSNILGPMQGPRGPNPGAIIFSNCPPIPGIDSNHPRNFHNGQAMVRPGPMSGPIGPMGHSGHMGPRPVGPMVGPSPRIPIPAPTNRFPGPVSPMLGPRPVGPGGPVGPISLVGPVGQVGPIGQVGSVVQMGPRGPGPNGPMPNQNVPVSNIRPVMPSGPYMAQPVVAGCNVQMFKGNDPVTLQISNLPPTTNFVNLGQKLSELGHVVFLEFTTPGCAVVRFASPSDAERCFQNYRKVLG